MSNQTRQFPVGGLEMVKHLWAVGIIACLIPIGLERAIAQAQGFQPQIHMKPLEQKVTLPKTRKTFNFYGNSVAGPSIAPPPPIIVPLTPEDSFKSLEIRMIITYALSKFVGSPLGMNNLPIILKDKNDVISMRISTINIDQRSYQGTFEIIGKSTLLSLGKQNWVERHRFLFSVSKIGPYEAKIQLIDYEPMYKTSPDVPPPEDVPFTYIPQDMENEIGVFQQKLMGHFVDAIEFITH
ncbi:hypothetical protein ABLE93_25880 [Xanthobacter sp. KR7-65]|uniref:hypothetical protein n=1 Tax=Xanthobacter sp. KR7-65 TaxID=3156612 RepID=UPI0032B5D05D